jgi:hypothetical protein
MTDPKQLGSAASDRADCSVAEHNYGGSKDFEEII